MAFQGFAREEQFSTNQIKIDINSVIENDLAEASRQSKIMANNASLQEKWSGMYLNALINKHEAERRNREDNWNSFQKNREAIQEQINYNNEVKLKDAERSHPYIPSFMDMLQPALMQMAVDVGATGIKKLFDDHAKHKAEAAAKKQQANLSGAANFHYASNEAQREFINSGALDNLEKGSAAEQQALEKFVGLNPGGMSVKEAQAGIHYRNGLTDLQRQGISHSPEHISKSFGQFATNFIYERNGIEVNLASVQNGRVNRALSTEFWAELKTSYFEQELGGLHKLHPVVGNTVWRTVNKVEAGLMHVEQNNRAKEGAKSMQEQFISKMENIGNQGGSFQDKVDYWFGANGPSGFYGHKRSNEMFEDWVSNGGATIGQVDEYMRMPQKHNGGRAINDEAELNGGAGTARSDRWNAIRAGLVKDEYTRMNNDKIELANTAERYKRGILNMTPDEADSELNLLLHGQNKAAFSQFSKTDRTEITSLLLDRSGKFNKPESASPGTKAVAQYFNTTFLKANVDDITGEHLAQTDQPSLPAKTNLEPAKNAMEGWIAQQLDDAYENGRIVEGNALQAQTYINNLFKDPQAVQGLKDMLRVETQDPVTKKAYEAHEVKWKGLNHDPGIGEKTDGIQAYSSMVSLAQGEKRQLSRREIMSNPVVRRVLKPWLDNYQDARDAGLDVQPIIRNGPPLAEHMARHWKFGSLGQVLNAAIDHGGYEESYKRLADMEYQTAAEVQDRSRELGILFSNQPQQVQNHINQFGVRPASYVRGPGQVVLSGDFQSKFNNVQVDPSGHGGVNAHNHYGYRDTAERNAHSAYIKKEYKRLYGTDLLMPGRSELEVNFHDDRADPNSWHSVEQGNRAGDWPGHNFIIGKEVEGLKRIDDIAASWYRKRDKQKTPQQQTQGVNTNLVSRDGENPYDPLTQTVQWLSWKQKQQDRMIYAYDRDGNRIGGDQ